MSKKKLALGIFAVLVVAFVIGGLFCNGIVTI